MPERHHQAERIVVWVTVPICGTVLAFVAGVVPALLTAAAFAVAHVGTLPNSGGRRVSLSAMVAVAAWLLTDSPLVVASGAALGMPLGWVLIRFGKGTEAMDQLFPSEPLAAAASIGSLAAGHQVLDWVGATGDAGHLIVVTVAAVVWYVVAATVRALVGRRSPQTFRRMLWWDALADGPAYAALFSAGALFGLTFSVLGWWSVPLAGLPYAFSHLALGRLAKTRRTYRQTIIALGRIPEAGGYVHEGHAGRTAGLSRSIGAELGFGPTRVQRVEYVALLHDVGRVVLNDPSISAYTQRDLAQWSAAIISESATLAPVAAVVARHKDPYRRPGEERDPELPREAQVVKVAASYDHAVVRDGVVPSEALEELHRGAAYDFDPEVVAALRRVLQRRAVEGV